MSRFSFIWALGITVLVFSCNSGEKKADETGDKKENAELKDPQLKGMMNDLNEESTVELEDGFHEIKYPDGTLKTTGTISNGKKEGLWVHYRENGEKWSECNFTNGVSNGKVVSYHPNGQVNYIGYFTNGTKSGQWMFYDTEGKLIKEVKMTK